MLADAASGPGPACDFAGAVVVVVGGTVVVVVESFVDDDDGMHARRGGTGGREARQYTRGAQNQAADQYRN